MLHMFYLCSNIIYTSKQVKVFIQPNKNLNRKAGYLRHANITYSKKFRISNHSNIFSIFHITQFDQPNSCAECIVQLHSFNLYNFVRMWKRVFLPFQLDNGQTISTKQSSAIFIFQYKQ